MWVTRFRTDHTEVPSESLIPIMYALWPVVDAEGRRAGNKPSLTTEVVQKWVAVGAQEVSYPLIFGHVEGFRD